MLQGAAQFFRAYFLKRFRHEYWHFPNTPQIIQLSGVLERFRELEKDLQLINFPDNQYNKVMGFVLQSINSFELIITRYPQLRRHLIRIGIEENRWLKKHPNIRSYKVHPDHNYTNAALRVDVESLFIFGTILVTRSLLLLKLYLPDPPYLFRNKDQYHSISNFYWWMSENQLSPLGEKFKVKTLPNFKWLYAVLREYRNEFIEHMDAPYQQGMNYQTYGPSFQLSSYKWGDITDDEKKEITTLKSELKARGISLPGDKNERHFAQILFEAITSVPNDLLNQALKLSEQIGVQSPEPQLLINMITDYMQTLFDFLKENLPESELEKYRK